MAASNEEFLTTLKNVPTALNNTSQTTLQLAGIQSKPAIAAASLLKTGQGRVATVIVTTTGSAGAIYDTASVTSTANIIYVIPAVLGVYVLNFPFSNGLVVAPGSGQVCSVSFS